MFPERGRGRKRHARLERNRREREMSWECKRREERSEGEMGGEVKARKDGSGSVEMSCVKTCNAQTGEKCVEEYFARRIPEMESHVF